MALVSKMVASDPMSGKWDKEMGIKRQQDNSGNNFLKLGV